MSKNNPKKHINKIRGLECNAVFLDEMNHFEIWVCPCCGNTIKFDVLPDGAFNPRFCNCRYPEFLIEYKKVYEQ